MDHLSPAPEMSRAVGAIAAAAAAGIGAYALFRGEEQRSQDFRAVDGALGGVLGGVLSKAGLGGKQQGELPASCAPQRAKWSSTV